MRVCVLYDDETYGFTPAEFLKKYEWEMVTLHRPVFRRIEELARENRFDVYFNLCDGAADEDYPGVDVIEAMEKLNMPFTGANSRCYDPTREDMQSVADVHGIGFVRGYHVTAIENLENTIADLHYPLMVKHPRSYSSIGMTKASRVNTPAQLKSQVQKICLEYGSARVEEFIVGREFNVFIVDNPDDLSHPFAYPPTELIFPPGEEFWHSDVKWDYSLAFEFRRVEDMALAERLKDVSRRMFLAMGASGYGRLDIRMNAAGELLILEINPNGGILYLPEEYGPADYMILYDPEGYDGFFRRIFGSAILRRDLRARASDDQSG